MSLASSSLSDQTLETTSHANHLLFRAPNVDDADLLLDSLLDAIVDIDGATEVITIESDGTSIGIEQLREIRPITAKKSSGNMQIIVIRSAHRMTIETQNYLLKELEDTVAGKKYLLSSDSSNNLLPTIVSRTHAINYKPQAVEANKPGDRALYRAVGYSHTDYTDLSGDVSIAFNDARKWLTSEPLDRMILNQKYQSSLPDSMVLIDHLKILLFGMLLSQSNGNNPKLRKTITRVDILNQTATNLAVRGNIKLILNQLALNL